MSHTTVRILLAASLGMHHPPPPTHSPQPTLDNTLGVMRESGSLGVSIVYRVVLQQVASEEEDVCSCCHESG